jgi:hypothetical protein
MIVYRRTLGKLGFLIGLINLPSKWSSGGVATERAVALEHTARAVAEEVWWLFTFLTAKEDEAVNACIAHGLVQVRGY